MLDRNIFSERFKTVRLEKKLTMVDIANSLGISKQSVHEWQTKRSAPSADKLVELADYFDVSIDYLVGRSDVPERR
jgi:transcriptional regulator with XRE-family HTH domain